MRKAVLFDVFSSRCQFFNIETAGGNGCDHPEQMIWKGSRELPLPYMPAGNRGRAAGFDRQGRPGRGKR